VVAKEAIKVHSPPTLIFVPREAGELFPGFYRCLSPFIDEVNKYLALDSVDMGKALLKLGELGCPLRYPPGHFPIA
jgi:hypothetical protein